MPDNANEIMNNAVIIIALVFMLFLFGRYIAGVIKNRRAPVKTVKAQVVAKHILESFSKYSGSGKQYKYVIVFLADGKKKSFYVSEFSYGSYRLREQGTLTYKGDRLIDFS